MQYGRYARVRPYADPYSETFDDDADDDTLVSHWSVDEQVQKLLYDDDEVIIIICLIHEFCRARQPLLCLQKNILKLN